MNSSELKSGIYIPFRLFNTSSRISVKTLQNFNYIITIIAQGIHMLTNQTQRQCQTEDLQWLNFKAPPGHTWTQYFRKKKNQTQKHNEWWVDGIFRVIRINKWTPELTNYLFKLS